MTETTMAKQMPDKHALWRWAEGIMHGSGASLRSAHRIVPRLHILVEGNLMWCSGGKAMPFAPVRPEYCPECLKLAREMWDDLGGDE